MLKRKLQKKLLMRLIQKGLRAIEIAEKVNCSAITVVRACDFYGINRPRKKSKAVLDSRILAAALRTGMCAQEVATKFSCNVSTVHRTCRRMHMAKPVKPVHHRTRKQSFNTHFFDKIDTEAKAYVLGFIAADGGLDRLWGCKIALKPRDVDILDKIASAMQCSQKPRLIENGSRVRLAFYDVDTVKTLQHYGIVERKTYTLPFALNVPGKFVLPYLRGVFDGDGSIGRSVRLVTGSKAFFEGFMAWYQKEYGMTPWSKCENGTKWRVVMYRKHARFIHNMYANATIVSDRRKKAYLAYWSNNDMVRSRK